MYMTDVLVCFDLMGEGVIFFLLFPFVLQYNCFVCIQSVIFHSLQRSLTNKPTKDSRVLEDLPSQKAREMGAVHEELLVCVAASFYYNIFPPQYLNRNKIGIIICSCILLGCCYQYYALYSKHMHCTCMRLLTTKCAIFMKVLDVTIPAPIFRYQYLV